MILVVPKNTITPAQKGLITKKGFILIECDEPEKVRIITPEVNVDANDYFMSTLKALTCGNPTYKQEHFVNELYKRLKAKEAPVTIDKNEIQK